MSKFEDAPLEEITSTRYLNYALSVITSRALPDIRDGLKPVQRRVLYAMYQDLHLGPDARFKKSAKVVGEVMGNYHPHGDQSIYDAMVRLAQDFAMRYPLVDGHGNFGSLDGDPPAAMRYTEARLQHIASELLDELKQDTVEFQPTYDGTRMEPVVLPAQVPNLLINGTTGIAVGMATNIPPHNLREVVTALVALIDDPSLGVDALAKHVKAPDFPTGGEILNTRAELLDIYRTGGGAVKLRGTWELEKDGRKTFIIITSIPYALDKSALVARIGELISNRQVPQLVDVRDESTEDVRVVLEVKGGAEPEAAMAYLYKNTPLASNFHVNMTCLVPQEGGVAVPRKADLHLMLRCFLDFRFEVVTKRHEHELKVLRERLHLLEGFEKIFADLDKAIALIRKANGRADAHQALKGAFVLSDIQAAAVLDTKLYKLSRMEIKEIQDELAAVRKRAAEVEGILSSESARWGIVRNELMELSDAYGDKRRTQVKGPVEEVVFREEDYIIDEDAWIVVTREGWIKRQKRFTDVESIRTREGDAVGWLYRCRAKLCVTFLTNNGQAYTMRADRVPLTSGHGEPLGRHFSLADGEQLVNVFCHDPRCLPAHVAPVVAVEQTKPIEGEEEGSKEIPPGPYILAVTRLGKTLRVPVSAHTEPSTKNGRLFCRLGEAFPKDQVVLATLGDGTELVGVATHQTRVVIFKASDVTILSGAGRGVLAIKLDGTDYVIAAALLSPNLPPLLLETSRGGEFAVNPGKQDVSARGAKGTTIMARAQFLRAKVNPVVPVPELSQIRDDGGDDEPGEPGPQGGELHG